MPNSTKKNFQPRSFFVFVHHFAKKNGCYMLAIFTILSSSFGFASKRAIFFLLFMILWVCLKLICLIRLCQSLQRCEKCGPWAKCGLQCRVMMSSFLVAMKLINVMYQSKLMYINKQAFAFILVM